VKHLAVWLAVVPGLLGAVVVGCGDSDDDDVKTTTKRQAAPGVESNSTIRITYLADSPYGREVTSNQLERTADTLRRRAKLLGLDETRVSTRGRERIVITYPPRDFADPANSQLPVQGRLFFYDFEGNLVGSDQPIEKIYEAVDKASRREPVDSPDNTTGEQFYLFDGLRDYRGGPTGTRKALLERFAGKVPPENQVLSVPPGTIVVLASPLTNASSPTDFDGNYIMRDRPSLDNRDITDPKVDKAEASDKPSVTFQFTPTGQRRFRQMTRELAERSLDEKRSGDAAEPQSFAVVLDNQILSRPTVDPDESRDGIDPTNGAQLAGDLNEEQTRHLAAILQSGPLPVRLVPLLQTQVER
jgi:SecD/SecF fusion protein